MNIFLLILASVSALVHVSALHGFALLLHALYGLFVMWRVSSRQPLLSLFLLTYVLMYFINPIAIAIGAIPLEAQSSWKIFYVCNAYLMLGFDIFLLAARRNRAHENDFDRMPFFEIEPSAAARVSSNILILITVAMVGGLILIILMGINPFAVDAKTIRATGTGTWIYLTISYLAILLPFAAFVNALRPSPRALFTWIIVVAILFLHFLMYQIRTLPVAVLIAVGCGLYLRSRRISSDVQTIPFKSFRLSPLRLIVTVVIGLSFVLTIKYARYTMSVRDMFINTERITYILQNSVSGGDLAQSFFTRRAIELFPEDHPYLLGQSYYRVAFIPIPRFAWPGKPQNTQRVFAAVLDRRLEAGGVTIPPGIVGDLYINFGPVGIAGMFVFGLLFRAERYVRFWHCLLLASSGIWLFHFVRGGFTNPLIMFVFFCVLARLIERYASIDVIAEESMTETVLDGTVGTFSEPTT